MKSVLERARDKIKDPERWTQHTLARSADDGVVSPVGPDAVCWCLVGAIDSTFCTKPREQRAVATLYKLLPKVYRRNKETPESRRFAVESWNDQPERTHKQVINLLNKAIRQGKEK